MLVALGMVVITPTLASVVGCELGGTCMGKGVNSGSTLGWPMDHRLLNRG